MKLCFLDASAWAKRYIDEPGKAGLDRVTRQADILACSSLGFLEMRSTLVRRRRSGSIPDATLRRSMEDLAQQMRGVIVIDLDRPVLAIATSMSERYALRAADTVHLASAEFARRTMAGERDEFVLVSSDQELNTAASMAGFVVFDPVG